MIKHLLRGNSVLRSNNETVLSMGQYMDKGLVSRFRNIIYFTRCSIYRVILQPYEGPGVRLHMALLPWCKLLEKITLRKTFLLRNIKQNERPCGNLLPRVV